MGCMDSPDPGRTQIVGEGRVQVRLDLRAQGRDWLLVIAGGQAHVGAVAVAAAPGGEGPAAEVLALPGHKEGPLAQECALLLARAGGRACAVVAGIHQERATPQEIFEILANVRLGAARLAAVIAGEGGGHG